MCLLTACFSHLPSSAVRALPPPGRPSDVVPEETADTGLNLQLRLKINAECIQ